MSENEVLSDCSYLLTTFCEIPYVDDQM